MAAFSTVVAVAALAVAAVGTGVSIYQGRKAAKAQERMFKAQQQAQRESARKEQIVARQERAQQLREQQRQRASLIASSYAMGSEGSSAAESQENVLTSRIGGNEAFINQINSINQSISSSLSRASSFGNQANVASSKANTYGQIASLATSAYGSTGESFSSLNKSLFGSA